MDGQRFGVKDVRDQRSYLLPTIFYQPIHGDGEWPRKPQTFLSAVFSFAFGCFRCAPELAVLGCLSGWFANATLFRRGSPAAGQRRSAWIA
jgi:hypothetical protein